MASVSIQCSTGQTLSVVVELDGTTVGELKALLQARVDAVPAQMRVIYGGRVLKDHETLASHAVRDGHTVHLVIGPPSSRGLGPQPIGVAEERMQGAGDGGSLAEAPPCVTTCVTHAQFLQMLDRPRVNGVVIVYFTASWCGPCRRIAPVFQDLARDVETANFVKVDVDQNPETAAFCNVTSMPTFQLFRGRSLLHTVKVDARLIASLHPRVSD